MNLVINFEADFEDYMRQNLTANGFKHIPHDSESLYIHYCNILARRIAQHKRNVQKSDVFTCPKSLRTGLEILEAAINKGENLLPWQSKNILNTGYDDHMCANWGIYHLHLGDGKEVDSPFMIRTGLVLYCMLDFQNIYFIQIMEHGEKHVNELLAIAKLNWPDLFIVDNLKNSKTPIISASAQADHLRSLLSSYENQVIQNSDSFARQIKRVTHRELLSLEFHLSIDPETGFAYAEEIHSKVKFKLGLI